MSESEQPTGGTEVAKPERRPGSAYLAIRERLEAYLPEVARALPEQIGGAERRERFVRVVMNTIRFTPELAACTLPSVVAAVATAAALGMEPGDGTGRCYIIPYRQTQKNGRVVKLAQFQIGYRGLIDLAHRGGLADVAAYPVYREDEFSCLLGTDAAVIHRPSLDARHVPGNIVAFYAVATTAAGTKHVELMTKADVDEVRKRSQATKGGPWASDYAEMGRKTVLKRCLKQVPLATDARQALAQDEAVRPVVEPNLLGTPNAAGAEDILEGQVVEEPAG